MIVGRDYRNLGNSFSTMIYSYSRNLVSYGSIHFLKKIKYDLEHFHNDWHVWQSEMFYVI